MLNDKLEKLRDELRGYGKLAVAFSGGVDSTFLLLMAQEAIGENVLAVTAEAPPFPFAEMEEARLFCNGHGIHQIVLDLELDKLDGFKENPPNRCYLCKKSIFSRIMGEARENGISCVADGTNADDMMDYRPGLKALEELKVVSPLKNAGFTKAEIRQVLKNKGLAIWEKPAYACLATRIPYGEEITGEKLERIGGLEADLHKLGFLQVRVRYHGDVARIEVLPEERENFFSIERMEQVNKLGRDHGFKYVALDLAGYKMGSLNL